MSQPNHETVAAPQPTAESSAVRVEVTVAAILADARDRSREYLDQAVVPEGGE